MLALFVRAGRVELQLVPSNSEASESFCNRLLLFFQLPILELEDSSAIDADQVIVQIGLTEERIKASDAITEVAGLCEIVVDQQFERPIHRRVADSGVLFFDDVVELLHAYVLVDAEEVGDDSIALASGL